MMKNPSSKAWSCSLIPPPGMYWSAIRTNWLAPKSWFTSSSTEAPPTFVPAPARMLPLGSGRSPTSKWPRRCGTSGVAPVPSAKTVSSKRAPGFGALTSSHCARGRGRHGVRHAELDPEEVVRSELLTHPGDVDRERAREDVERLLERVQVPLDPPVRLELAVHDGVVDGTAVAVEERAAGQPCSVACVRSVVRRRLVEPPDDLHR